MKRLLVCGIAVAALALGSVRANAATLTILDYGTAGNTNDGTVDATWTLTTATGCTSCATTLSVTFSATSIYAGKYLDSVGYAINGLSATGVTLNSTTAGATSDWSFDDVGVVSAGGCTGNNTNEVCGDWISGGTGGGFGHGFSSALLPRLGR